MTALYVCCLQHGRIDFLRPKVSYLFDIASFVSRSRAVEKQLALAFQMADDAAFIGARPTPLLACGVSGPVRNTVEVVVLDVEPLPMVGKRVSAGAALVDEIESEVLLHPVGQFVAVRKLPLPRFCLTCAFCQPPASPNTMLGQLASPTSAPYRPH